LWWPLLAKWHHHTLANTGEGTLSKAWSSEVDWVDLGAAQGELVTGFYDYYYYYEIDQSY